MSNEELDKKYVEISKELMKAKTQIASKQNPDKPGKVKQMKKTIARINTIKNSRGEK